MCGYVWVYPAPSNLPPPPLPPPLPPSSPHGGFTSFWRKKQVIARKLLVRREESDGKCACQSPICCSNQNLQKSQRRSAQICRQCGSLIIGFSHARAVAFLAALGTFLLSPSSSVKFLSGTFQAQCSPFICFIIATVMGMVLPSLASCVLLSNFENHWAYNWWFSWHIFQSCKPSGAFLTQFLLLMCLV